MRAAARAVKQLENQVKKENVKQEQLQPAGGAAVEQRRSSGGRQRTVILRRGVIGCPQGNPRVDIAPPP